MSYVVDDVQKLAATSGTSTNLDAGNASHSRTLRPDLEAILNPQEEGAFNQHWEAQLQASLQRRGKEDLVSNCSDSITICLAGETELEGNLQRVRTVASLCTMDLALFSAALCLSTMLDVSPLVDIDRDSARAPRPDCMAGGSRSHRARARAVAATGVSQQHKLRPLLVGCCISVVSNQTYREGAYSLNPDSPWLSRTTCALALSNHQSL